MAQTAKMGMQMSSRLRMLFCSIWKVSATMRRAARSTVSPVVMGANTTPSMASMPPKTPNQLWQMKFTT